MASSKSAEARLSKADLFDIVSKARFAPSSHNTQPWRFKIEEGEASSTTGGVLGCIRVYADGTLRLIHTDADGRELLISCGAAIGALLVEVEARGLQYTLELIPIEDACSKDIFEIAIIKLKAGSEVSEEARKMAQQIEKRLTFRSPFQEESLSDDLLSRFKALVSEEACWLHVVPNERRAVLADMVYDANEIQWSNSTWRKELAHWIRPSSAGDGLHIGPDILNPLTRKSVGWFKFVGNNQSSSDRSHVLHSPVMAVLGCDSNKPQSWVRTGIALERMLLLASMNNVFASYVNQPLQVKEFSYLRVSEAIGRAEGCPCLIIRMGKLADSAVRGVKRSSRRPTEDVII